MSLEAQRKRGPEKPFNAGEAFPFPHAEAALKAYLKAFPEDGARADVLREVFQEFIREEVGNTSIFKSEKTGVELPYTRIGVGELAKKLYVSHHPLPEALSAPKEQRLARREFVFGTSVITKEGNQFNVVEEAMHQCIMRLPAALEDIAAGREPEMHEIYTLGMPTNVYGFIPEAVAERLKSNPYEELGKIYGELIERMTRPGGGSTSRGIVELYGSSLGANLAIRAGESLMESGAATQSQKSGGSAPLLRLRVENPVSLSSSKLKPLQIPIGFLADALIETRLPAIQTTEAGKPAFFSSVDASLAARGIQERMDGGQKNIKESLLRSIIFSLGKKFELKPGTRVTSLYGLKDMTTLTPGMLSTAKAQRDAARETLGQTISPRKSAGERRFVADMLHYKPRYYESELRRMRNLAVLLEKMNAQA